MFFLPWVSQAPQVNRFLLNNWHHLVSSGRQLPRSSAGKNSPATSGHAGDMGPTPGLGRSPGGRKGNPLHCSCLGNPMHRGEAWRTPVQEIAKSRTPLTTERACSMSKHFMLWGLRNHQKSITNADFWANLQNSNSAGVFGGPPNLHFYKHPADLDVSDSLL